MQIPLDMILGAAVVMMRVSFMLAFMPFFGEPITPMRVRILFGLALTMILAPLGVAGIEHAPSTLPALIFAMLPEALVGLTLATLGRIFFGAIQFAGQIAGREMGFAMANEIDPTTGIQITVVAQMEYALAAGLFFLSGAHVMFIEAIAESFRVIPAFGAQASQPLFELIVEAGRQMFYLGLKLNFPIIGVMICVNVTFALLAKAVPNLNIMLESFPVRILAGLAILYLTLPFTAALIQDSFSMLAGQLFGAIDIMAP